MICPRCGTEYREGFVKCADCGEWLVDPEAEPEDTWEERDDREDDGARPSLVPLATLRNPGEYLIIRMHFDAAGIEYYPGSHPHRYPAEIMVRTDQAELAFTLLEELDLTCQDPFAAGEKPEPALTSGLERPAGLAAAVEALIPRYSRYLVYTGSGPADDILSLPGGLAVPGNGTEGALEASLRRILAVDYGVEVDEELHYVGSRLKPDGLGGLTVSALFLARWRDGMPEDPRAQWLFAGEVMRMDGVGADLRALIERADKMRAEASW